jgi:hypothetical protein
MHRRVEILGEAARVAGASGGGDYDGEMIR